MSLRQIAKILGVHHSTLSKCINGQREWKLELKERYEALVATTVVADSSNGGSLSSNNLRETHAYSRHDGGAGGTRTPYLFNAIEALSQMSYSPTL